MFHELPYGISWVGQQTPLNLLAHGDRNLPWTRLALLFAVTLMPFSTGLMVEFIAYRVALLAYRANILLLGVVLFASWRYALAAGLVRDDAAGDWQPWVERRIVIAQMRCAFGALLRVVSTY